MTTRANGPTARNSRLMYDSGGRPGAFFRSPCRAETVIMLESGQNDDGVYAWFVRVQTGGTVTYEENWTMERRGRDRFERVVENHVEGRPAGL